MTLWVAEVCSEKKKRWNAKWTKFKQNHNVKKNALQFNANGNPSVLSQGL